ncbi:TIM barrel protein [Candidatus Riflebacteria bacterium]
MNFNFGFFDYEPFQRLDSLYPQSFSLSQFGGFARWRNKFNFLEVGFDGLTLKDAMEQKETYLKHIKAENLNFGASLPFYRSVYGKVWQYVWHSVGEKQKRKFRELNRKMVKTHMELFAAFSPEYIAIIPNRPGIFFTPQQEKAFWKKLDYIVELAKALSLKLIIRTGGIKLNLLREVLKKYTRIELNLDLQNIHLEGLDFFKVFKEFQTKIKVVSLAQTLQGRALYLPLEHKGVFNFISLFHFLKKEGIPTHVLLSLKPSFKDINYLMENLIPADYNRLLSKSKCF